MTVRTTISMPDDLWEKVERQQKDTGASVSEIVRRALTGYFPAPTPPKNGRGRKVTKATPRKRVVKAK